MAQYIPELPLFALGLMDNSNCIDLCIEFAFSWQEGADRKYSIHL